MPEQKCPKCSGPAVKNGTAPGNRQVWICKECGHVWREKRKPLITALQDKVGRQQ